MHKGIILIILSAICVSIGQLFWKLGASGVFAYILFGFCLYSAGALLMIAAFKYGSVSVLQPLISLSYIAAIILGYFILDESITCGKVIGTVLIIAGTVFLSKADRA